MEWLIEAVRELIREIAFAWSAAVWMVGAILKTKWTCKHKTGKQAFKKEKVKLMKKKKKNMLNIWENW